MTSNNLLLLKHEIENKFGRKILSSSDCLHLCNEILRNNGVKISFNTIRRFFNLMKTSGNPSVFTLNTLSTYCGNRSFDMFMMEKRKDLLLEHQNKDPQLLQLLILLYNQIDVDQADDSTFVSVAKQTVLFLEHCPNVIDSFQKEIANTANGQTYYFEKFVFLDKLNSYYGQGLHYYLGAKNTKEAQVFGHYLLCLKSWLTADEAGRQTHAGKISNLKFDSSLSLHAVSRYYASQILGEEKLNSLKTDMLVSARKLFIINSRSKRSSVSTDFGLVLAEALVLKGMYEEAMFYLDELASEQHQAKSNDEFESFQKVNVLRCIALAKTNNKTNAYEVFHKIDPYRFNFLSRKYYTILYLLAKRNIKINKDTGGQLEFLIEQTGFVALLS